ncbi:MAG TPA: XdhC family protein [Candidatus Limnocylindria bacterium]
MEDPPGEGGDPIAIAPEAIYGRVAELDAAGEPFALATVVAVQRPTSARPGAHGLILPDGTIEGWVGGSCAQPVVVREALRAMTTGEPRLLRLSREPVEDRRGDGAIEYVMTCHSGGTMEVYVEPHLPKADLWVCGLTPIAAALVRLGAAMGFRTTLLDPSAVAEDHPDATVLAHDQLLSLSPDARPFVVVATQGQWDEEAVAMALARSASYVGLVASPTRAAAVRAWLVDEGVAPEKIENLRAPSGMDVGATTPEEVAVSILAELIAVRRGRASFATPPLEEMAVAAPSEEQMVLLDPVCGMTVDPGSTRHIAEHAGTIYAFCSAGCRTAFRKDPEAYLQAR